MTAAYEVGNTLSVFMIQPDAPRLIAHHGTPGRSRIV
jgi:hypothetical protein